MKTCYKVTTEKGKSCLIRREFLVLDYPKGEVVKARKGSLGIMVFETRKLAFAFSDWINLTFTSKVVIRRAKTIGPGTVPDVMITVKELDENKLGIATTFNDYLNLIKARRKIPPESKYELIWPDGTICYESILMID